MTTVTIDRTVETFANNVYTIPNELEICEFSGEKIEFSLFPPDSVNQVPNNRNSDFGSFRIMSPKDGDKRVVWCRRVIAQIQAAKKMFVDLIAQGMVPYEVGVDGQATSKEMKEFDPLAEEVIFLPIRAISGG